LEFEQLEDRLAPASFTVVNNFDSGAGSLRAAVDAANLPANAGMNTITFASPLTGGQTITLTSNDTNNPIKFGPTALVIAPGDQLTISGDPSQAGVTISGNNSQRIFAVMTNASLTLQYVTLTGGLAKGGDGGVALPGGGGGGGAAGLGGAIFNAAGASLTLIASTLSGNNAQGGAGQGHYSNPGGGGGGGGGLGGNANHQYGGPPNPGGGGGNPGGYGGGAGGVAFPGFGNGGGGGFGGGGGGGFSPINGNGSAGGLGGFGGGGGGGAGGGPMGGSGAGGAGTIFGGGSGGAGGTFPVGGGGGGGGAGLGGAIFNNQGAKLYLIDSTLYGNTAQGGAGGGGFNGGQNGGAGDGFGGAIFNRDGTVTLTNSTLAGNTVQGTGANNGGALFNLSDSGQTATVNLFNSILSGSSGGKDLAEQQVSGTATVNAASSHVNIVQTSSIISGVFNNSGVSTANPNLGKLTSANGGPTATMLPLAGSPAIDTGNNADAPPLTDQRGDPRIVNSTVDLGAVEVGLPTVTMNTASQTVSVATLVIQGANFSPTAAQNTVTLSLGAVGSIASATSTQLTINLTTLPTSAGVLTAVVTTGGRSSGAPVQVATVIPTVTYSSAKLAPNAATVVITGTGFSTDPTQDTVAFNLGAAGTVTSATATQLTVSFNTDPTGPGSLTAVVTVNGAPSGAPVQVATVVETIYTVDTLGDAGVSTGPFSGDLRYCISQADALTNGTLATIVFSPSLASRIIDLSNTGALDPTYGPSAFLISNTTTPILIDGGAAGITIDRNSATGFRLFAVGPGANLTLQDVTLSNGLAKGGAGGAGQKNSGGGGGAAGLGGAVFDATGATLTLLASTLSGNTAQGGNGAASSTGGAQLNGGGGGGLDSDGSLQTPGGPNAPGGYGGGGAGGVTGAGRMAGFGGGGGGGISNYPIGYTGGLGGFGGGGGGAGGCGGYAFFGNTEPGGNGGFAGGKGGKSNVYGGGGGGGAGLGGAIFNNQGATLTVCNSTLYNNQATGGTGGISSGFSGAGGWGLGGAIFNRDGTVTITSSTLAGNSVSGSGTNNGGALFNLADTAGQTATVNLYNSILSGSIGGKDLVEQQLAGTATVNAASPHVNLVQSNTITSGSFNNSGVITANPNLGALTTANGGPTATMLPLAGSPAIDDGNNADASGLFTDQRGFTPRIVNGTIDLGSVEVGAVPIAGPAPTVTPAATVISVIAPTVVINGTGFSPNPALDYVTFTTLGAAGKVTAVNAAGTQLTVSFTTNPTVGNLLAIVTSVGGNSGAPVQVATVINAPPPTVTASAANIYQNALTMTITGNNFSPTTTDNTVTFSSGAVGTVTTSTNTQLTVTFSTQPTALGALSAVVTSNMLVSALKQVATVIAPVVITSNNTVTAPLDGSYVFQPLDFPVNDPIYPGDTMAFVTIVTLPAAGTLTLNAAAVSAGQTITATQINNGDLVYTPAVGGFGPAYASFTFQVTDQNFVSAVATETINVTGADLLATAFSLVPASARWNDTITINYTLKNQGQQNAGPFTVDVRISTDSTIDTSDLLLAQIPVAGLAAGGTVSGTLLPVTLTGGSATGLLYVGLIVNSGNTVPETNYANNSNQGLGIDLAPLQILGTSSTGTNHTFGTANAIDPNSNNLGTLTAGNSDYYSIIVPVPGLLTASVTDGLGSSLDASLSLYAPNQSQLLVSDGIAPGNLNPLIHTHVDAGTYYLVVSTSPVASGIATVGAYTLATSFSPATDPVISQPEPGGPLAVVTGDFNGDGFQDVAVADYASNSIDVRFGLGDGSFGPGQLLPVGAPPVGLVAADFNNDNILDLVAITQGPAHDLVYFQGLGNGTFAPGVLYSTNSLLQNNTPQPFLGSATFNQDYQFTSIATANVNGKPDLVVGYAATMTGTNEASGGGVFTLLGNGNGTFMSPTLVTLPDPVYGITAGDFNGDGNLDVAVATGPISPVLLGTYGGSDPGGGVTVLYGTGGGTYLPAVSVLTGTPETAITTGDFNGDHKPDLAAAGSSNGGSAQVFVNSNGSFLVPTSYKVGAGPAALAVADFNGDGKTDLIVADNRDNELSLLLGNGDGTFQAARQSVTGLRPMGLAVADFNKDGVPDVITADGSVLSNLSVPNTINTLTVSLGNGDGNFLQQTRLDVGADPTGFLTTDLNNDGVTDLVLLSAADDSITVGLGNINDTITVLPSFTVGNPAAPPVLTSFVAADFNGDGRMDLAVADNQGNIYVYFGIGDGTFDLQHVHTYHAPVGPGANTVYLAAADFNGDGKPDLTVSTGNNSAITVFLNNGDGTFGTPHTLFLGYQPGTIAAGDFNGDGKEDLAVASAGAVHLLYGDGTGGFSGGQVYAAAITPQSTLVVDDFNADHISDLAVAEPTSNAILVLLGQAGANPIPTTCSVSTQPMTLTSGVFVNVLGYRDLAYVGADQQIHFLANNGAGNFLPVSLPSGDTITDPSVPVIFFGVDLNNDGRTDLFQIYDDGYVDPRLNLYPLDPIPVESLPTAPPRDTPLLANLNGVPVIATVRSNGNLLLSLGQPNQPTVFQPALVLNPGNPVTAAVFLHGGPGLRLAAIEPEGNHLFIYTLDNSGRATLTQTIDTLNFPTEIAAADLNGDGIDDIVVSTLAGTSFNTADFLQGVVSVYLANPDGSFGPMQQLNVGGGPSDIALTSVGPSGLPDILVSNQLSGTVSVMLNQGNGTFAPETLFRASSGAMNASFDPTQSNPNERAMISLDQTDSLAVGDFNGDGMPDIVTVNANAGTLEYLQGEGKGAFANPVSLFIGGHSTTVRAGDFNGDGNLDLAVLDPVAQTISIFLGDGHGHFTLKSVLDAGNLPTSLTLADLNGDGKMDIAVSNPYGDLLFILGNGDGTFRPYVDANNKVPFVTTGTNSAGQPNVFLANQASDQSLIQLRVPGTTTFTAGSFVQTRSNGLQAPGAVQIADLNGDGIPDMMVANSGSNNVLIYVSQSDSSYKQVSQFAGTNPTGMAIADLNGDGIPDLVVVNTGSNDVSVLFGSGTGNSWTLLPGPRLKLPAGNLGPIAVSIRDVNGDGIPDLVVTCAQSGTVCVIPGIGSNGVGTGFFEDNVAYTLTVSPTVPLVQMALLPGSSTIGFALTTNGTILSLNVADIATPVQTVFTSTPGALATAFEPVFLPNSATPSLFVATTAGTVDQLDTAVGGFEETQTFSDASLVDPSSLAVVLEGDAFEIYLTNAGDSLPLVIAFNGTTPVPTLGVPEIARQVAEVVPLDEATVATVGLLTNTFVPEPNTALVTNEPATLATVVLLIVPGEPDTIALDTTALVDTTAGAAGAAGSDAETDVPEDAASDEGAQLNPLTGLDDRIRDRAERLRSELLAEGGQGTKGSDVWESCQRLFGDVAEGWRTLSFAAQEFRKGIDVSEAPHAKEDQADSLLRVLVDSLHETTAPATWTYYQAVDQSARTLLTSAASIVEPLLFSGQDNTVWTEPRLFPSFDVPDLVTAALIACALGGGGLRPSNTAQPDTFGRRRGYYNSAE
jgi:hypothetical protein